MSDSDEVATGGTGGVPSRPLTAAQLAVFWDRVLTNYDAARRMAARYVSRRNVDDIVHTAANLFIEYLEKPENQERFPHTDGDFRGQYLTIVGNHAKNCVGGGSHKRPVHSHWAEEQGPTARGRKVADRELGEVFARDDDGRCDASAPQEPSAEDADEELRKILWDHIFELTPMQAAIIVEAFVLGRERAEIAQSQNISIRTYDAHRRAALHQLRLTLVDDAESRTGFDRSEWYDRIEEMSESEIIERLRRACAKRRKGSTVEGDAATVEGDGSTVSGARGKSDGSGAT